MENFQIVMHAQLKKLASVRNFFFHNDRYLFHVDTWESWLPSPSYLKKRGLGTIFNKKGSLRNQFSIKIGTN